ncbi:MAG: hypothetical protein ACRELY_28180 [Polyangiaceae bacterium]
MSPCLPLGKKKAMELVKKRKIPFQFGTPHPFVAVVEQEGKLRIRRLLVDPVESRAQGEGALMRGEEWMPEHHYALGQPTGEIFVEAASTRELLERMAEMDWPEDW